MEIRDVIHGAIALDASELPVIDSRHFQRLRHIRQMGFSEHSFPAASHSRYIHSLGAMETASQAFSQIFKVWIPSVTEPETRRGGGLLCTVHQPKQTFSRLRACVRLAALLHDIGHGPLSHTTEFAMPQVHALKLPARKRASPGSSAAAVPAKNRQATHEDYTLKIILDSELTPFIERAGKPHGFTPWHVASLIERDIDAGDDFFVERVSGKPVSFQPVLQQLISSELDADRMDYLRRDSFYSGVSYGQFDFQWLASNLTAYLKDGKAYLGLQHRALYTFEDFLLSRFHMFLMVYYHYKSVIFDEMLKQYLKSDGCTYQLPSDISEYLNCHDDHLYSHLEQSRNEWARRIVDKKPYRMLLELHSGIPAARSAAQKQERMLAQALKRLERAKAHYLLAKSTGQLSKYFQKPGLPIYVRYDNHYSRPEFIPLEKCTDLFQKYGEKRSIERVYVSPENYARLRQSGRGEALRFEDGSET